MQTLLPDGDVAGILTLRARVSNRLARYVRTTPATFSATTPLVSLTFDDVPDSAAKRGADMLGAYGAKATFYVCGKLIGQRAPYWQHADEAAIDALHADGHEIGCHTHSHAFVPSLSRGAFVEDLRSNQGRLREIVPAMRLDSFAFPYGYGSLAAKRALRKFYATSRTIMPGINSGRVDCQYLAANPLIQGSMDPMRIERLMDEALACNGWLIFYGHDVADSPSPYGCSPSLLDAVLRSAAERHILCVSVAEAFRRIIPQAEPWQVGQKLATS